MPLHFREPSINLGVGEAKGQPPHLVDADFREHFKIAAGSADAFALTSDDFVALARNYGRMGGLDRIATLVKAIRAERGDDKVLLLDGGDTWQGSWTSLQTKGQDMVDVMSPLKTDAMTGALGVHARRRARQGDRRQRSLRLPRPEHPRHANGTSRSSPPRKMFEKGGVKVARHRPGVAAHGRSPIRAGCSRTGSSASARRSCRSRSTRRAPRAPAVVVLLSHNGFDVDRKLASRVKGIDVILTAHTHDAMPGLIRVGETLLVASGSHGKFVSRLDLDVQGRQGHRHPLQADAGLLRRDRARCRRWRR